MTTAHALEIPGTAPGTFLSACSACHKTGETDDHPKVHYGAEKYHFDCLPARVVEDILGNLHDADRARFEATVAHATADGADHLHGHDLRARAIHLRFEHPRDDEQPLTEHEQAAFLTHVGAALPTVNTKKGKHNG